MSTFGRTVLFFLIRGVIAGAVLGIIVNWVILSTNMTNMAEALLGALLFGLIYGTLLGGLTSLTAGLAVGLVQQATTNTLVLVAVAALAPVALVILGGNALFAGPMFDAGLVIIYLLIAALNGGTAYLLIRNPIER